MHVGTTLGLRQVYFGNTLGGALNVLLKCSENALRVLWEHFGCTLGILWEHAGSASGPMLGIGLNVL